MAKAHAPDSSHYFIPHGSPWPIRASIALFAMMLGAVGYLNDWAGAWSFLPGAVLLAYMFFGWFSTVIDETQHGVYNLQVDRSFRMAMMWFIFSEVMFFGAFFGALFYARVLSVPLVKSTISPSIARDAVRTIRRTNEPPQLAASTMWSILNGPHALGGPNLRNHRGDHHGKRCFDFHHKAQRGRGAGVGRRPNDCIGRCGQGVRAGQATRA